MKKYIFWLSCVLGLCLMAPTMSSCSDENLNAIMEAFHIGYRKDHGECVSRIEAFKKESGEILASSVLTLEKNRIEVDEAHLFEANLVEQTPLEESEESEADSIVSLTKTMWWDDGQVGNYTGTYLKRIANTAKKYGVEVIDVRYVGDSAVRVENPSEAKIHLLVDVFFLDKENNERAQIRHAPYYWHYVKEVTPPSPAKYTYVVKEYPTRQGNTWYNTVVAKKYDAQGNLIQKWQIELMEAQTGKVIGRKVPGVNPTNLTETHMDEDFIQDEKVENRDGFKVESSTAIYRRNTNYAGEVSVIPCANEILFYAVTYISLTDPETGELVWEKRHTRDVERTSSEFYVDSSAEKTYFEQGYDYKYISSQTITFRPYLDGQEIGTSVATNHCYTRVYTD